MIHKLSFAAVSILNDSVVEVTVNEGVEITIEMLEECDDFLEQYIKGDFAFIFNKIHDYSFTFESKMLIGSNERLQAIAIIVYSKANQKAVDDMRKLRLDDDWNLRVFSGLELGWQEGFDWVTSELEKRA